MRPPCNRRGTPPQRQTIIEDPECPHDRTWADKYGYVRCDSCHTALHWEPILVRPGIYGRGTSDYVRETAARHNMIVHPHLFVEIDFDIDSTAFIPDTPPSNKPA